MEIKERNISELIPAEYNPRYITDGAFEQLKEAYTNGVRQIKKSHGLYWKDIPFICLWCLDTFYTKKATKSRFPLYCSQECCGKKHADHKTCKNCGDNFYNHQNKYFCSMACAGEHKRGQSLSEDHCKSLSEVKKGKPIKYFVENREEISKKISKTLTGKPQPWNRGENHPRWVDEKASAYSHQWKIISKDVREDSVCHRCGTDELLEVHHIIPYRISKSHSKDNLVVLCKSCHQKTEHNNIKAKNIIGGWELLRLAYKLKFEDIGRPIINE